MFLIYECVKGGNGFLTARRWGVWFYGFISVFFLFKDTRRESCTPGLRYHGSGGVALCCGRPKSHCWSVLRNFFKMREWLWPVITSRARLTILLFSIAHRKLLHNSPGDCVFISRCSEIEVTVISLMFCSLGICLLGDFFLFKPYWFCIHFPSMSYSAMNLLCICNEAASSSSSLSTLFCFPSVETDAESVCIISISNSLLGCN